MLRHMCTVMLIMTVVAPGLAQTTFTFAPPVGDSGVWSDLNNWIPPIRPPGPGDEAIIPNLKTCTVDDARTAEIVTVNTGGTLIIDGNNLTIDTNNDATHDTPTLTVNGTLKFQKVAGVTPKLLYGNTGLSSPVNKFTINGTGTILADGSAGHAGIIDNLSGTEHILEINSGVTLKGSLTIECDNGLVGQPGMLLDGTFVVDNSSDDMTIGVSSLRLVRGAGTFEVSAGDLVLTAGMVPTEDFSGSFEVAGGTITILGSQLLLIAAPNNASFHVSSGVLFFSRVWESYGGMTFEGGSIRVIKLIWVTFKEQ